MSGALAILLGGAGAVIFGCRFVDAMWRGQLLVSDRPKAYSGLATNPVGFEIGLAFTLIGVLVSLAFLTGGVRAVSSVPKRRFARRAS